MAEINYVRTLEAEKPGMFDSFGVSCGFSFHRGESPDLEKSVPTYKLGFITTNQDGKVVVDKRSNYKDKGVPNANQIILPDNPEAIKALGEFCLEVHANVQKEIKEKLAEAKRQAEQAGVKA